VKVLFTHDLFPPDVRGGGEMLVFQAAQAVMAKGIELSVLTTGDPRITEHAGIRTERLPFSRYRMNLAAAQIARAAADVDIIQTFNYHACLPSLWAGRRLNKPVFCIVLGLFDDLWREMKPFPLGFAWQAFERFQVRAGFDCLVFISEYSRQQARRLLSDTQRTLALHPGIEAGRFKPAAAKQDMVLFNGKFDLRKGVYEVLEVARALPQVPFCMYGFGSEEAYLRSAAPANVEVRSYSAADRRLDSTDSSGLPDLLSRARICLLPSKAETFGFALIQAMAAGCAIVSSIPLEFAGQRVNAEDTAGMIQAVRELWEDRGRSGLAALRNVELSKQYTWERFATGLVGEWEQVLRERRQTE
jgi:glycosyltransferase involved in cell wall biosynthesis